MRRVVGAFEAEPVHARDLHGVAVRIDDLVASGGEPAIGRRASGGIALGDAGISDIHYGLAAGGIVIGDGTRGAAIREGRARGEESVTVSVSLASTAVSPFTTT